MVPITAANVYEAAEPANEARRERLARFMVDLSANHSLINHQALMHEELTHAVTVHYLKRTPTSVLRTGLMQSGHYAAMIGKYPRIETGHPDFDRIVLEAMYDPEVAVAAIVRGAARETMASLRAKDRDATTLVERIRAIDANLSLTERRRLELENLLSEGALASMLDAILARLGIDSDAFRAWVTADANFETFIGAVPAIDVPATLMLRRDANQAHRTHPNDGKDFTFLQVAVPYANFVVAERAWTHFVVASGLATRHDTVVITEATRLPQLLEEAGCI